MVFRAATVSQSQGANLSEVRFVELPHVTKHVTDGVAAFGVRSYAKLSNSSIGDSKFLCSFSSGVTFFRHECVHPVYFELLF